MMQNAVAQMNAHQRSLVCQILNFMGSDILADDLTLPFFQPSYILECIDGCRDHLTNEGLSEAFGIMHIIQNAK